MGLISRVSSRTYRDAFRKMAMFATLIIFIIIVSYSAAIVCQNENKFCETEPRSHKSVSTPNSAFVSTSVHFDDGFHGIYNFTCGNFSKRTRIRHTFPRNVFTDLDEVRRMFDDPTTTLFSRKDICSSKYPINIENPAWIEQPFSIYSECTAGTRQFDIPVHIRYHRSTESDSRSPTFSSTDFKTTICGADKFEEIIAVDNSPDEILHFQVPIATRENTGKYV